MGEGRNGRIFQHLLMDYNNLESTSYADIARFFEGTERRLLARKTCTDRGSEWSVVERDLSVITKDNNASAEAVAYWNEPIAYTLRGKTYRLSAVVGPMNTTGSVPNSTLLQSSAVTRQTLRLGEFKGVDAKGELRDGSRWRYFVQCGDFLNYFDVPPEAADYFDRIIDGAYLTGRRG